MIVLVEAKNLPSAPWTLDVYLTVTPAVINPFPILDLPCITIGLNVTN